MSPFPKRKDEQGKLKVWTQLQRGQLHPLERAAALCHLASSGDIKHVRAKGSPQVVPFVLMRSILSSVCWVRDYAEHCGTVETKRPRPAVSCGVEGEAGVDNNQVTHSMMCQQVVITDTERKDRLLCV